MLQTIVRKPRTAEDIAQGARLARISKRDIGPGDVAAVLNTAKVKYVLVGAHAANGYTSAPRNTLDVDILARHPKQACAVLTKAFPDLTAQDTPVVVRFKRADGDVAIDVMKPGAPPLWRELIKIAKPVRIDGELIPIPPVEGVLAAKLAAMTSPARLIEKKMFDGGDFIAIVKANPKLDMQFLERLGDLVYPGGGKEILKLVADAKAGKRLEFSREHRRAPPDPRVREPAGRCSAAGRHRG
ncbi:MAG TPA: hypothetical protein PLD59_03585 [Tepidisphaeraceae bacterium]|nr:hypothetical protein [Tepidisphaeraceae bacterium]